MGYFRFTDLKLGEMSLTYTYIEKLDDLNARLPLTDGVRFSHTGLFR